MKKIIVGIVLSFMLFPLNAQNKPTEQSSDTVAESAIDSLLKKEYLSPAKLPDYKSVQPAPQIIQGNTTIELGDYKKAAQIDSLWLSELNNSDLYPKLQKAIMELPDREDDYSVLKELPTDTLKKRLS